MQNRFSPQNKANGAGLKTGGKAVITDEQGPLLSEKEGRKRRKSTKKQTGYHKKTGLQPARSVHKPPAFLKSCSYRLK
ncbi:hypothetical protein [Larkinella arboricola]|uniref:hypothetical protein n=1 Tax=Larkinella arboricola TaxID=643671 RepID=UPI000DB9AB71|nr:hypothetical protein [Larkinella arboricola]